TLDVIGKHVPNEVTIFEAGSSRLINVNDVKVGDVLLLKAGEKSAIDGEIIEGEGSFDESSLTGESDPIYKTAGDRVISGTTSIDAVVKYRTTKDFSHSTLSNLVALLESAVREKPKIEQLANKLSEYFSAIILFFAVATFAVWWYWPHDFATAFMVGISVIIIACPCALALATPVATLVGLGLGAQRGILYKEAAQLETMAKADTLVLDKTGTITVGRPEVVNVIWHEEVDKTIHYTLVQSSKHPVAQGIGDFLYNDDEKPQCPVLDEIRQISAKGMVGRYEKRMLLGGNAALMQEHGIDVASNSEYTLFYFAVDDRLVATFELTDRPKEDAEETISALKHAGIDVLMLTGDHERAAARIAKEVGIDTYRSEMTPDEKAKVITALHDEGRVVVMAGDGVNDILALAKADIGIAMGNGSDIAIDVSDVVLMNDSLTSLLEAFKISKTTFRLVKQNLGLSLVYNAVTIPLAMAGYVIPLVAAISMSFSSLLVVGNSMRIRLNWNKK
ncbi:MAG: cation-translocating P-type ATPase, partial [Sulfurimonadaceae bacterium]|nr:cation-translocating P-type ATPase [Sulfurimonadaceae bacterium]